MIHAPAVVPMFGIQPHTPALCEQARTKRGGKRPPCPTCGSGVRKGSILYCMTCERGSPETERAAARHVVGPAAYDLRKPPPKATKPKPPKLTKRERRALIADARAGEHELPVVQAYLDSIADPDFAA